MITRSLIERPEGWMLKLGRGNQFFYIGPLAPPAAPVDTARLNARNALNFLSKHLTRIVVDAKDAGDL